MKIGLIGKVIAAFALLAAAAQAAELAPKPVVTSPRIYVIDCGTLTNDQPESYGLTREEVKNTIMGDMCYLIVHPKGTLMWDTGLADRMVGRPIYENMLGKHVGIIKMNTLVGQLADIGYTPDAIDYMSLSHSHFDHSGNANAFVKSTWLVAKPEYDVMFNTDAGDKVNGYADFAALKNARTVYINDNHDVFGDGSVVVKQAFGHSPGHSILQVKLKATGTVLLVGDLYHYPEEMTLHRMGEREAKTATPQSRAKIEALAKDTKAQIWIAHDLELFRKLKREPAYYD